MMVALILGVLDLLNVMSVPWWLYLVALVFGDSILTMIAIDMAD